MKMKTFLKTFLVDETGASAAEYALIIAVVGVGVGAAALVLGNNVGYAIGQAADEVHSCNQATGVDGSTSVDWTPGDGCADVSNS
jgi:pilus assembly protein Flp/PilA